MNMTLVGAGFRPELAGLFDGSTATVGCAELIANRYFSDDGVARAWELETLAGLPIILHGLSGNVASATGPTREYLESIRRLAEHTDAMIYSDHLAFTAAPGRALGHLAPNRYDDSLLRSACEHIEMMNEVTGRRVVLENLATKTTISGSAYTPEEFYLRLLEESDRWDCLLDLTNIWINSQNRPVDALEFVHAIPADRIRYVHLAGGRWMHGELIDSHSEAVHEEAFDLLELLLDTVRPQAVIVERDSNWEHAYTEVMEDVAVASQIVEAAQGDAQPSVERRSA
jgi:uncharacterized protein (UPF0276 family)